MGKERESAGRELSLGVDKGVGEVRIYQNYFYVFFAFISENMRSNDVTTP